ncbi:MAG: PilN domain-containing protein [Rhodocyclaceae bacterium]|nr:PilN domain-containing protein [Rhodocyclaceae bacterium]MCA3074441.1 PilN domain-containing protein [Rhodocyclaceae bacterium]MCA3089839.1 PilN domain-containing protein [Rhodocyclaceae bacterium]MCA3093487.1 PilN domain-containing protein [Rhodocyclaceae bacterium]MCA3096304.1 PilN domain-containing protein [Rhodocyclaceae bacterium]
MIRVNLLPHRQMKRAAQKRAFIIAAVAMIVLGAAVVFLVHGVLASRIEAQSARNKFLDEQIVIVNKQIEDIRRTREQTAQLLARKRVVETLQSNREEVVQLFDQIARQLPDGVYLRNIKQTGTKINIAGYAQSNARVSTLLRNLESSPWLENATLIEIKAATVLSQRLNEFSLNVDVARRRADVAAAAAPGAPGAPSAAPGAAAAKK